MHPFPPPPWPSRLESMRTLYDSRQVAIFALCVISLPLQQNSKYEKFSNISTNYFITCENFRVRLQLRVFIVTDTQTILLECESMNNPLCLKSCRPLLLLRTSTHTDNNIAASIATIVVSLI